MRLLHLFILVTLFALYVSCMYEGNRGGRQGKLSAKKKRSQKHHGGKSAKEKRDKERNKNVQRNEGRSQKEILADVYHDEDQTVSLPNVPELEQERLEQERLRQLLPPPLPPTVPFSPKFITEVGKFLLTIVPYKLAMLATAEVFPTLSLSHPDVNATLSHPSVKGVIEHALMRQLRDVASSEFVVYSFAIISFVLVPYFGFTARIIRTVRRFMFAVSYGLLLASLTDMFLDGLSAVVSEKARGYIATAEKALEVVVFLFAFIMSHRSDFVSQVIMSVLGSGFIMIMHPFYKKAVPSTDSATGQASHQTVNTVMGTTTDAASKFKNMFNKNIGAQNNTATSASPSGTL